jgi:hypothetical protein
VPQQGSFSRIRPTDQADVSDELEHERQGSPLAWLAIFRNAWGSAGGGGEACVAPTAAATRSYLNTVADGGEVRQQIPGCRVVDLGTWRYRNLDSLTRLSVAIAALAVRPAFRPEYLPLAHMAEVREVGVGHQNDVTTRTPVAAARPALRDVLLAPEGHAPTPSVAGLNAHFYRVAEHRITAAETAGCGKCRLARLYGDELAAATLVFEGNHAINLREQRVVAANSDVDAGLEAGATLPNEDRAARDKLTTETLDAQAL